MNWLRTWWEELRWWWSTDDSDQVAGWLGIVVVAVVAFIAGRLSC